MKNRTNRRTNGKLSKHVTANQRRLNRAIKLSERSICGEVR
jgi:hypothetical protein